MAKFKRVTDYQGNVHAVNPAYVTHIEPKTSETWKRQGVQTEVFVVSNAGYGTKGILVRDSMETIKSYLEEEKDA